MAKPGAKASTKSSFSGGKKVVAGILAAVAVLIGLMMIPDSKPMRPASADRVFRQAEFLQKEGKMNEAVDVLEKFVEEYPKFSQGHYTFAIYLRNVGRYEEARLHNLEAIKLKPNFPEAYVNLGICQENVGDRESARASYEKALELRPKFYEALDSLAILSFDVGKTDESRSWYAKALEVRDSDAVRIKMAIMLPPVYKSAKELQAQWDGVGKRLRQLLQRPSLAIEDAQRNVGQAPFYFAYAGFNNKKYMESLYQIMSRADPNLLYVSPMLTQFERKGTVSPTDLPLATGNRIRVGLLSRHLRWHSIGKLMRGFVKHLSRKNIELIIILPPQRNDEITQFIVDNADHHIRVPNNLAIARKAVADLRLHALLYPDIGMEMVSHGHPCTTGLPTVDHFVSFKAYEDAANQKFYTEKLALLDGLSSRYFAPELPESPARRADFGFTDSDHIYLIPQSLFKFHPTFDTMMLAVLRANPHGKIAIISERHAGWAATLLDRLRKESNATAEEIARIVWLPRAPNAVFLSYIAMADVVLDTYPFGGDTSSRESLLMSRPIVTLPAEQLAGRYTQAFLRRVGVPDLIASSPEEYVKLAVEVAQNKTLRDDVIDRISQGRMKLFEQQDVIQAWEQFIVQEVERVMPSWTAA